MIEPEDYVPPALRQAFCEEALVEQGIIFTERRVIRRNVHLLFQQGVEVPAAIRPPPPGFSRPSCGS